MNHGQFTTFAKISPTKLDSYRMYIQQVMHVKSHVLKMGLWIEIQKLHKQFKDQKYDNKSTMELKCY